MIERRVAGEGWLALLGGGEFSFGETEVADRAWLAKVPPGEVAFLPAASGSTDYGEYFTAYMAETFQRQVEVVPIYRRRDARRGRNLERIAAAAAVYLGAGVADHLLDALRDEPAAGALESRLAEGGVVVAIAAAAQALGIAARGISGRESVPGLGWLEQGVVEPNFDPGHDRRLRQLLGWSGARWGLGLPAGSAVLLGPGGAFETIGPSFLIRDAEGDIEVLSSA